MKTVISSTVINTIQNILHEETGKDITVDYISCNVCGIVVKYHSETGEPTTTYIDYDVMSNFFSKECTPIHIQNR